MRESVNGCVEAMSGVSVRCTDWLYADLKDSTANPEL